MSLGGAMRCAYCALRAVGHGTATILQNEGLLPTQSGGAQRHTTTLCRAAFRALLIRNNSSLGGRRSWRPRTLGGGRSCQTAIYVRFANIITKKEEAMTSMVMVLTAPDCAPRGARSSKA